MERGGEDRVFSHSLWSDNWGIHTKYRVAFSAILTRVESDDKKYLLARESCQTPIYLRGGHLFTEFVGPEGDCFMGTISLQDLVFIPLLNTLNMKYCFVHGPVYGRFDASRYLLSPQFKRQ